MSAGSMPAGREPERWAIECRHASGSSHWAVEPECGDLPSREAAEAMVLRLERLDEDGAPLEYRARQVAP